ncbi:MAG: hypothetical protein HRU46_02790 [Verrucomicrobiales bacterium]|nr:hypothetical protein [Verrucomicrobiales bacterium]
MTLSTLLHEFIPFSRAVAPEQHGRIHHRAITPAGPDNREMIDMAKTIIHQQWPLRHHSDPATRRQARNLIKTHLILLRLWMSEADQKPQLQR